MVNEEIEQLEEIEEVESYETIERNPSGGRRWKNNKVHGEPVIHAETGTVVGYIVNTVAEVLGSDDVNDIIEDL